MTERVKRRLAYLQAREYRRLRSTEPATDITSQCEGLHPSWIKIRSLEQAEREEKPLFLGEDDVFGFNQYRAHLPKVREAGWVFGNNCIDYASFLQSGLNGICSRIAKSAPNADEGCEEFYEQALAAVQVAFRLVEKYREAAKAQGNDLLYEALCTVPENGAKSYYQALISLRFLCYFLRLNKSVHLPLGRFDFYTKPYYDMSKEKGASEEELLELTELFFIALNFDTDLYDGIQVGDNGQSMMLGGCDEQGRDAFNELSELCLQASEELCVIDPKINVRVNKNTPLALYERCTKLTKQGLGFPQYSNDDVVIPALLSWGYSIEDARNYAVAACWEFIPSGCGAEVPNLGTMVFPLAVENATKKYLLSATTYEQFSKGVEQEIIKQTDEIIAHGNMQTFAPDVVSSLFINCCIERGRDISRGGAKYRNFGMHGAGISTAADALEGIERAIFIEKYVSAETLLDALEKDFVGYEALQKKLLSYPKMGNNEDSVDKKAAFLMDVFSRNVNGRDNGQGGVWRAGTGSAMEYVLSARKVGATADGRKAKDAFGCSFSPALTARVAGPLSAVLSFTKYDLQKVCNGGPFTIEIHDTVFRNTEGETKTAMLVKAFIDRGGHQIQINAINRDRLLEAQKHPENHPNLIVRVWGWSGYFNELDVIYQNHVIRRMEFNF